MNMWQRMMVQVSAAALCMGATSAWATLALAQDSATGVAPPAQSAQAAEPLQEVVITATKRAEKLSSATIAGAVLGTNKLGTSNITDVSQIGQIVPSVSLNGSFNGRVPYAIRGISSQSNEQTVGLPSGVSIEVDGIPVPSDSIMANPIEDIQNVEVLVGPQATLGGRTAAQGEINYVTKGPSDTFTGSAEVTMTDDGERHAKAFLAGPLSDKLSFSAAAWGHAVYYPVLDVNNGTYSNNNDWGGRVKIAYKPTDDLDMELMLHGAEIASHGSNFTYAYLTPGACILFTPCPPFLTQGALLPGVTPSFDNEIVKTPVTQEGVHAYDHDLTFNINYTIGGYQVSSTTSYQHELQHNVQDLFIVDNYFFTMLTGGNVPFPNYQTQYLNIDQTTEELKLQSPANDQFNYVAGVFYSDTNTDESYFRTLPPAALNFDVTPDTATYDVYGHANWKALPDTLPDTTLVFGARYNLDRLKYTYNQVLYAPGAVAAAAPNKFIPGPACADPAGDLIPCYSAGSSTKSAIVGDISIKQQLNPDVMAYIKYSHGYAPSAYNTAATLGFYPGTTKVMPLEPVNQEKIDSFEIGTKGAYFDHRLRVDADAFDTIYSNFQIQTYLNGEGISPPLALIAAAEAETRGVEVNVTASPTERFSAYANAAYIDAKFNNFPNSPCYPGQSLAQGCHTDPTTGGLIQNVSGDTLQNSPKFKFVIGATDTIPLDFIPMNLLVGADYTWRDSAQMLADQNPKAVQGAYGLLNLHATLSDQNDRYSVTLFVNNVANQHFVVDVEDFFGGVWSGTNTLVAQPGRDSNRYFGATMTARF
jgi:iron complex outermembrane receptor protein